MWNILYQQMPFIKNGQIETSSHLQQQDQAEVLIQNGNKLTLTFVILKGHWIWKVYQYY